MPIEVQTILRRAVTRSENPRGLVVLGGDNVPPLVELGLTDLLKTPPSPPLATALLGVKYLSSKYIDEMAGDINLAQSY